MTTPEQLLQRSYLESNFAKDLDNEVARLKQLEGFQAEYTSLKELLESLPHKTSHSLMVPFGKAAFMPGNLIHTNEILVHLGESYYSERSASQALEVLERRAQVVQESLDSTYENLTRLRAHSQAAKQVASADSSKPFLQTSTGAVHQVEGEGGEKFMEIREEFDASLHLGAGRGSEGVGGAQVVDLSASWAPSQQDDAHAEELLSRRRFDDSTARRVPRCFPNRPHFLKASERVVMEEQARLEELEVQEEQEDSSDSDDEDEEFKPVILDGGDPTICRDPDTSAVVVPKTSPLVHSAAPTNQDPTPECAGPAQRKSLLQRATVRDASKPGSVPRPIFQEDTPKHGTKPGTSESVAGVSPQPVCGVAFTGQVLEKPVAAPVSSNIFTGDTVRKDVGNEGSHSAQLMPQPSEQRNTRPMSRFKQKRQGLL